ncbi:MAG: hypothetical protein H0U86_04360 [Chloroflexi bacterium]|nr:hypothetical protein [Chloroflexota bacterium]
MQHDAGVLLPALRSRTRIVFLAIIAAVAVVTLLYLFLRPDTSAPLAAPVEPRYPDLRMGPIDDITVGLTPEGTISVRFPATIGNFGDGDFLVRAARAHPFSDEWKVLQRVTDADARFSQRETPATLVWGGDGHNHWHVKHVEAHRVETLDGEILGEVVKGGFCFFDTDLLYDDLPATPDDPVYSAVGCGGQLDLGVHMGLSVGWGDRYPTHMLDQTVRVNELPDGNYVVRMIADPFDWFVESDETNNEVATEIAVGTGIDGVRTVEIVGQLD